MSNGIWEPQARTVADEDSRYFLPAVDGSEMRSRWDMQSAAPDILITNYSMLSIALAREDEQPLFDQTRAWLASSPEHVFTLVVDELHTYRGTQGTEVAYLLRRLLHRLGLDTRPDQLSVVATSASPERRRGPQIPGRVLRPRSRAIRDRQHAAHRPAGEPRLAALTEALRADDDAEVDQLLPGSGAGTSFYDGLTRGDETRPRPFSDVAGSIFRDAPDAQYLLDRVVAGLARQERPEVRLRAHLFFRTLQGLWACADPECEKVPELLRSPGRRVGKIYPRPLLRAVAGEECWSCCTAKPAARSCSAATSQRRTASKAWSALSPISNWRQTGPG